MKVKFCAMTFVTGLILIAPNYGFCQPQGHPIPRVAILAPGNPVIPPAPPGPPPNAGEPGGPPLIPPGPPPNAGEPGGPPLLPPGLPPNGGNFGGALPPLPNNLGSGEVPSEAPGPAPTALPKTVSVPVQRGKAFIMTALPNGNSGTEIKEQSAFPENKNLICSNGKVQLSVTSEPVWIVDGELPKKAPLVGGSSPFGMHAHPSLVDKNREKSVKLAQELGVSWARLVGYVFYFRWVTEKDKLLQELDEEITSFQNAGVSMVLNFGVCPPLHFVKEGTLNPDDYLEKDSYFPKNKTGFSSFVKAIVERYDGDGIDDMPGLKKQTIWWQIENEPCSGPQATHKGFAELMKLGYSAIKAANPEAKVLIAGFGQTPVDSSLDSHELPIVEENYTKHYLEVIRACENSFDVFDIHYFFKKDWWGHLEKAIKRIRKDLVAAGFDEKIPIVMTEFGTYSGKPKISAQLADLYYPKQSERIQASELVKNYVVAFGSGVQKIFWAWGILEGFKSDECFFDFTGLVYDGKYDGDGGEGVKKVAFFTLKRMIALLKYWNGQLPKKVSTESGVIAFRFPVGDDGKNAIIAVWLDSGKDGGDEQSVPTESIPPQIAPQRGYSSPSRNTLPSGSREPQATQNDDLE